MKINKYLLFILAILLILGLIILNLTTNNKDKYFKQIPLSDKNLILNRTAPSYYDTILQVGLDTIGIRGITINIQPLSDKAKDQFSGDLKAHIRLHNDIYYLFIDSYNKNEAIKILAHEIIHIQQYHSGDLLVSPNNIITWKENIYNIETISYEDRPWEIDAYQKEYHLKELIEYSLY